MTPWTIWERMLLHVLFGYHKLDFYGREWWAIYREITKTTRLERTCREDYKYSHGKERTQMYPRRILKPYKQYDDEERAAYDDAVQDVIDAAKRLGIVLPGSNGDDDEEDAVDEDEDNEAEDEEPEDEEAESEEDEDEDNENKDEYEEIQNEENPEMKDAEEDYAIAEEDGSQMDDEDENAGAQDGKVDEDFQMEDEVTEKLSIWGQHNLDVLEEAEFPATPSAMDVLISAFGAREMSRRKSKVSATPARNNSALSPRVATVTNPDPTTATGLSSSTPDVPTTPAKGTPALPDTSSGEPQKCGHESPEKQKLETVGKNKVNDGGLKRGARHLKKQLTAVGDVPDWLNGYDLDEQSEQETREPGNGATGKAQDNNVNGQTLSAKSIHPLDASKKLGASSMKPPHVHVKSAPAGPRVPLALVTNKFQVIPPATVRSEQYEVWYRENLDRLLFEEPYNMFPKPIKVPGKKRAPPEEPLSSDERVTNFFLDMFDRQLTKKLILSTLKKEPNSDKPGRRLKKIYKSLLEKAEEMSVGPRYRLSKVFDSNESPFSNFRLASVAFGQGLKMLHMSDMDYTGVGNQQLVAFAKFKNRHLTVDDIDFISPDDPVFKHGGRVHKLWIRQQECPIMGSSKRYNSAHVCMDVMICQEAHCPKCSKDKDMGSQVKSVTSLPRVHARHIALGNEFVAPLLMVSRSYEKDYKDEFIVDVNIGVQSVKLWDGTTQDVIVCDAGNCPGCCEASGGVVDISHDTRQKTETVTLRGQK